MTNYFHPLCRPFQALRFHLLAYASVGSAHEHSQSLNQSTGGAKLVARLNIASQGDTTQSHLKLSAILLDLPARKSSRQQRSHFLIQTFLQPSIENQTKKCALHINCLLFSCLPFSLIPQSESASSGLKWLPQREMCLQCWLFRALIHQASSRSLDGARQCEVSRSEVTTGGARGKLCLPTRFDLIRAEANLVRPGCQSCTCTG